MNETPAPWPPGMLELTDQDREDLLAAGLVELRLARDECRRATLLPEEAALLYDTIALLYHNATHGRG